jgi:YhzD-like protein
MYHMTVYDTDGTVLLDEALSANNDTEAKQIGYAKLTEKGYESKPHRIFQTTGRLIAFKPHAFNQRSGKATE